MPTQTERRPTEPGWGNPEIETAARHILNAGLEDGRSAIEPDSFSWRPTAAADLRRRLIDNADFGSGTFLEKLAGQLKGAARETILLTAELLYLQVVPLSNIKASTKHQRISTVFSWLEPPASLPAALDRALDARGVYNGGTGFNVQIWRQLGWLLSFLDHWWSVPESPRAEALRDPWMFRNVVLDVPADQPGIRNALLYLMFPQTFSPIVNQTHKRDIRNAFATVIGGPSGNDVVAIDRDLAAIRERQVQDFGRVVDWYDEPFSSQWQKLSDEGQRAWLVRPRLGGAQLVERWRAEGVVSLAAQHLGDVPAGADRGQVRGAVEEGYQHVDYAQRLALATEYHNFLTTMKDDDLIVTMVDDHVHVGVLAGPPEYVGAGDDRLRRPAAWSVTPPIPLTDLPAPLPQEIGREGSVVDLTAALAVLSQLVSQETDLQAEPDVAAIETLLPTGPLTLRTATAKLSTHVHADVGWLQEIIDLLGVRRQIVLYGPPGTGKTFIARALAHHVADADAVRLVQFHPSYAYEDFFEGYRPTPSADGTVGFALHPGPMRALAAEARDDPSRAYVLIIDEINRANLAKVFGELYFLLEYRDDSIRLQYSPGDSFNLPKNVYIIGTMNTADRSIALVDAAMRRRFAFVEMHPDEHPVDQVLRKWLNASERADDERADLLDALNAEIGIEDRDYKIGPSYLMAPDAETPRGLDRVWTYSILPLLEEHYYGRLNRAQLRDRFGLAAIRRRGGTAPGSDDPAQP